MPETHCAMGPHWCRAYVVKNGRRMPAEVKTGRPVCDACRVNLSRAYKWVIQDWLKVKLCLGEDRRIQPKVQTRRPKPGSRVLINLDGDQLMRDILAVLDASAEVVASIEKMTRPESDRLHRAGYSLSSQQEYFLMVKGSKLILNHLDEFLAHPDGPTLAIELLKARRNVVQHLGETAQREKKNLPCPSCGKVTLVKEVQDRRATDGTTPEVIRCLSCDGGPNRDGTWTEAEYQWLSTMVRSEREELDVYKWLLAEAQWRLSQIQGLINSPYSENDSLADQIKEYLPHE